MYARASAVVLMAAACGAQAHHSFAAYDMQKVVSAQVTLKEFHWGAPHSSADFIVVDKDGKQQTLTLIGAAPSFMAKQGFKPRDFRRGDKMIVSWHPNHSGLPGGSLESIKLPDGRVYKDTGLLGAPPSPQPGAKPLQGPPGADSLK